MNVTQEVLINKAREGLTDYQASLLEKVLRPSLLRCLVLDHFQHK